jgi:hypothetical protein
MAEDVDANFAAIKAMFDTWAVVAMDGGAALKALSADLSFAATGSGEVEVG